MTFKTPLTQGIVTFSTSPRISSSSLWYEGEGPRELADYRYYLRTPPLRLFHWLIYLRDGSSEPFRYKVMMFYLRRFTWQQFEFVVLLFYAVEKIKVEVLKLLRRQLNEKTRYVV